MTKVINLLTLTTSISSISALFMILYWSSAITTFNIPNSYAQVTGEDRNKAHIDSISISIFKDRLQGFEDGQGPNVQKAIEVYSDFIGFEIDGELSEAFITSGAQQLDELLSWYDDQNQ